MTVRQLENPQQSIDLGERVGLRSVHVFDDKSIDAVNAALAAGRPLLLRGEPGTGKSQLARAVAYQLGWPLVSTVIDSRVEARDLLWYFDGVARLAAAQIAGAMRQGIQELAEENFVRPGPLWWAFDWNGAVQQRSRCVQHGLHSLQPTATPAGWSPGVPGQGVVVLIDEIDKADPDVPNGLLEALGEGRFTTLGGAEVVVTGTPPLVLLTSNEERALPDAFVRRCLVHELVLPSERDALVSHLSERIAAAHFPEVDIRVRRQAAELLYEDRSEAQRRGWPRPGQAEYLDLIRAVIRRPRVGDTSAQLAALEQLRGFTYRKQPGQSSTSQGEFER